MTFLRNTIKEIIIAMIIIALGVEAVKWLAAKDPTIGLPDSGVLVLFVWQVLKLYLAVIFGHGLFRLLTPSLADYADAGEFRDAWKRILASRTPFWSDVFQVTLTLLVALACFAASLTTLLLAP